MPNKTGYARKDIILQSARGLLAFGRWITIFALAALFAALPSLFLAQDFLFAEIAKGFKTPPGPEFVWLTASIILIGLAILTLTYFTIDRLRKIVRSVETGNPFTRANGMRLRGMGIAIFVIQLLGLAGGLIGQFILATLGEPTTNEAISLVAEVTGEISLSGILLVLLLIILARVFDRGAEMHEELEATV